MTDKQIIIDGVDVHWCEHYTGNIGYLTDKNWTCRAKIQGTKCEDWSNCYFKRWKRKEQECEKLKEALNEGCLHNLTLMTEQRVLLQTLTEIKEICKKESGWVNCSNNMPTETAIFAEHILQKISECEVKNG